MFCAFQIIKQSFQTKCTSHWALVPVISHSERVMYAAAVTRWEVQFRQMYIYCALMNKDLFIFLFIRTVPLKSWSYLCPSVSQGPLEDRSPLLQIISAPCSLLKTPQTGFLFYVSVLHQKTTRTLVSFTRVTQCENMFFYILWINYRHLCHVIIYFQSLTCAVQLSLVHPSKGLFCQLQFQLMFILKGVPSSHWMNSTLLFPRLVEYNLQYVV